MISLFRSGLFKFKESLKKQTNLTNGFSFYVFFAHIYRFTQNGCEEK